MPALFEWRERDRRYAVKKPKVSAHGRKLLAWAHAHPVDRKKGNEGFEDFEPPHDVLAGGAGGQAGRCFADRLPGDAVARPE